MADEHGETVIVQKLVGNIMLVLGINTTFHDSAAVLLENAEILAAIEEERLNRIKHTTQLPVRAVTHCLQTANKHLNDIDYIAINASHDLFAEDLKDKGLWGDLPPIQDPAKFITDQLSKVGLSIPVEKLRFVDHHLSHATSAFNLSGFDKALVLSNDGYGDKASLTVWRGRTDGSLERLRVVERSNSLGLMYEQITHYLGYQRFDEYKVMGLAPYGDAHRFQNVFDKNIRLNADGTFSIDRIGIVETLRSLLPARKKGEEFSQVYKDLAAACQLTLEKIVFHVLRSFESLGLKNLALAGGVSLNCSVNGKILSSGMFEDIFVQPASHDAGGALGAALSVAWNEKNIRFPRLKHVYLGPHLGDDFTIESALKTWKDFVEFERVAQVEACAAATLAKGSVIGWVQDRSEFGPRALGHRSIIADPRPAENKDIVNRMVKKRESYRPFAPSVLEERVEDFFVLPGTKRSFPFMLFTVNVQEDKRPQLGAITHIDGTARIQTVSRQVSPRYWQLITEFEKLTGIPILLNTSFNNNAEPIVDSVEDAITGFLTTGLHYLFIGNFWVKKREMNPEAIMSLIPTLNKEVKLSYERQATGHSTIDISYLHEFCLSKRPPRAVSSFTAKLLLAADGKKTAAMLASELDISQEQIKTVNAALKILWEERLVRLMPTG